MAHYQYKCLQCGHVQDEYHEMKNAGNVEWVHENIHCESCKENIQVPTMVQLITGGAGLQEYSIMTTQERRDSLKKRSREHFKKHIEEEFHQKNKPWYIP